MTREKQFMIGHLIISHWHEKTNKRYPKHHYPVDSCYFVYCRYSHNFRIFWMGNYTIFQV